MFQIKIDDNNDLYCNNSIDLGFLGTYNSDMISIEEEVCFSEIEKTVSEREEEMKILTEKYNTFISNVNENIAKIKNQFIMWLFEDLTDTYFEFWECSNAEFPSFIIKDKIPEIINQETIYDKISGKNYEDACNEVFNKPVDTISGIDVFNKYLPMIDIETLLSTIIPSFMELSEYGLEFEINSNECDGYLLLATVGRIDNEFNLEVYDNRG
ncbi:MULTISPECIES: hypothetical protein [Clostridium]|uniref:DUF2262 domain-containing protein n=1 Tax=Clostridium botulinum TaxID=1491 RepID=A0A6B4JKG3_CLOBO|nr:MULTISPECIES: hypothetical protein [Clostridium]MBY6760140.1 hypothetical protein [Clostridium botulinum]MBY6919049.1 hypothetical protein [Clostridium botulinum]MBY7024717.1 hypothetical protein [Clostridium botulinum]MCR1132228.1 hypothetical protein [Clostridium botulinum]NFI54359.1 hypothetical protein [Clostridium botulinum]